MQRFVPKVKNQLPSVGDDSEEGTWRTTYAAAMSKRPGRDGPPLGL